MLHTCKKFLIVHHRVPFSSWNSTMANKQTVISEIVTEHDNVMKWKYFPRYWSFVRGIHRSPVNSPHKGQWRGALMFSLIWALNKRLSKQSWGWWFEMPSCSLWRHCNEFSDAWRHIHIEMLSISLSLCDEKPPVVSLTRHDIHVNSNNYICKYKKVSYQNSSWLCITAVYSHILLDIPAIWAVYCNTYNACIRVSF